MLARPHVRQCGSCRRTQESCPSSPLLLEHVVIRFQASEQFASRTGYNIVCPCRFFVKRQIGEHKKMVRYVWHFTQVTGFPLQRLINLLVVSLETIATLEVTQEGKWPHSFQGPMFVQTHNQLQFDAHNNCQTASSSNQSTAPRQKTKQSSLKIGANPKMRPSVRTLAELAKTIPSMGNLLEMLRGSSWCRDVLPGNCFA